MRRSIGVWVLACCAFSLAACRPIRYVYEPSQVPIGPGRRLDCRFSVLTVPPARPFEELGLLEQSVQGDLAWDTATFAKAVQANVCQAGGDAVVVHFDRWGAYVRGTVIRYQGDPPTPPAVTTSP
jgi:hypothetical protein